MGLARTLFINWHKRTRVFSDAYAGPDLADVLTFRRQEIIPFEVVIVEPDPTRGPSFFRRVDITDVTLEMAINDALQDDTPLAHTPGASWSKNTSTNTFTGSLDLNTSAMNTYIDGDKTAYFEIRLTTGGGDRVPVITETCNLKKGVLTTTTTSPDPAKMYLTYEEMVGLFVPRILGAGETITLKSPDGTKERILGVRDDGTTQDDSIS